jgi:hypothetical protein
MSSLSDAVVLLKKLGQPLMHNLLHFLYVTNDIMLDHISDGLIASNATHWVCLEGGTPTNWVGSEMILNLLIKGHTR